MADPSETVSDEADAVAETQAAAATSEEPALDSLTVESTRKVNEEVKAGNTMYAFSKKVEVLNLSPELLNGLHVEMGFEDSEIQAHNGSGKPIYFVLGMLSRIDTQLTAPQALCICPTPESAIKNMEVLLRMGKFTGITSELAIPADSANYTSELAILADSANYLPVRKRPPITAQAVIGTPGTISNLVTLNKLSMSFMKILVFYVADDALTKRWFIDNSRKIMKAIGQSNPDCQVLLFSATSNDAVSAFVQKIFVQKIKDIFNQDCNMQEADIYVENKAGLWCCALKIKRTNEQISSRDPKKEFDAVL